MTALLSPEMMARAIVSEPGWWQPGPEFLIDFDRLREHIAHAIAFDRGYTRAAERKACAVLICEKCAEGDSAGYDQQLHAYYHGPWLCAASSIYKRGHGTHSAPGTS